MERSVKELVEGVAREGVEEFFEVVESDGWEDLGVKNGVHGYQKLNEGKKVLKGVSVLEFDIETVVTYLMETRNKFKWEPMLLETEVLDDFGSCKLMHEVFWAPWPISKRDFVFVAKKEQRGQDILLVGKSVDVGIEVKTGSVRAECLLSGFLLRTINDANTEVIYILCIDPKGRIPKFMANIAASKQLASLNEIRKAIKARI